MRMASALSVAPFVAALAVAAVVAFGASPAASQQSGLPGLVQRQQAADSMKADSLAAAAADTLPHLDRFVPTNVSYVRSSDIDVSLGSRVSIAANPGNGWNFLSRVGVDRRSGRTQNIETLNQDFTNTAQKIRPGLYVLSLGLGQTYNRNTTLGGGRYGQEIVFGNTNANVGLDLSKPVLGAAASRLTLFGDGRKGPNDFKYDRAITGTASGAMNYVFGGVLSVGGGVGALQRRETSDIGTRRLGPMASNADTVNALLSYGRGQGSILDVNYQRYRGVERRVKPPRGNSFEILNDPSKAKEEETRSVGDQLVVVSSLKPFSYLTLDLKMTHNLRDLKYAVDTMLTSKTEGNLFLGTVAYQYGSKSKVSFNITTRNDLSDWTFSPSASYREREHGVSMGLSQGISDSLTLTANGSGSLRQRFYLNTPVNPRDADYLYYRGDAALRAGFGRITTNIRVEGYRYETVNIARDYSIDNRVDYRYQVGPTITVRAARWLTLAQDYILKIEYTDFVFTADKNYLNRTASVTTTANFMPFQALLFGCRHSYLMRDSGSYLDHGGGEQLYSPNGKTVENTLNLAATYQLGADFSLRATSEFRFQTNDIYGVRNGERVVASSTLYESGGMRAGFVRTKKFGDLGQLKLDINYVKHYGPYITPEQREYLEGDAELTLNF